LTLSGFFMIKIWSKILKQTKLGISGQLMNNKVQDNAHKA